MFNCLQPTGSCDAPHAVILIKPASHHAVLFYVPISSPNTYNQQRTHCVVCEAQTEVLQKNFGMSVFEVFRKFMMNLNGKERNMCSIGD